LFAAPLIRAGQDVSGKSGIARRACYPEQIKVLNPLLDGGEKASRTDHAAQYQAVQKVSKATSTRTCTDPVDKNV